jgi:Ca2+-binding EF-hand superfamily protein
MRSVDKVRRCEMSLFAVIAEFLTTIEELHLVFDQIDVNSAGLIDYKQFCEGLRSKRSSTQVKT